MSPIGRHCWEEITKINIGGKYPNNPLTIIIFAKDYAKFEPSYFENLNNRNVCVKGKIELYNDKQPQIIISDPWELTVE